MPRRLALLIAAIGTLWLTLQPHAAQRGAAAAGTVSVQILAINDFHGALEPLAGSTGQIGRTLAGGVEYLATFVARDRARNPNSIFVSAGDIIGASPLVSALFHDEPAIESMNAMHLAISSVGNHEFDKGYAELLRLKRGGCHPTDGCQAGPFAGAQFDYLAANVIRTDTGATLFPPTAVRTIGGVKVGFIGETLEATPRIVSPAGTRGLEFLNEATTANKYAAELASQGVHAIVLLLHEGGRQELTGPLDANGCDHLSGPIEPIVRKLSPEIPVVLTGHSHNVYNCRIDGRVVTSAASGGRVLTRVEMEIDRATDRVVKASALNEVVTRDVPKDPEQTAIVQKYGALAEATGNRAVGSTTANLTHGVNLSNESSLGDVIADAQLTATSAPENGGAVVAFMNSGGIRGDITTRSVTYRDLFAVQPFGNVLNVVTMTGDMIKRVLEQQFDNPTSGARNLLQVSNGFTYRFRANAPPGQHVDAGSITINGRPIGPADRVRVEVIDFMVAGGSGYRVFGEGTEKVVGLVDLDALIAYFRTHSPVAPGPQNRIVRID